jgi:basic amino acid/polyamine antiporter, APA family
VIGVAATAILSIAMVISALGAMNGSIMTGARVPYALAQDGWFPKVFGKLNQSAHVPYVSVIAQSLLAAILAIAGSFDQLTDYVVFASWISYGLVAYGVIRLRRKRKDLVRAYHVPLYPVLPIIFVIFSGLLLLNTLYTSPKQSMIGLLLLATGVPVFYWLRSRRMLNH